MGAAVHKPKLISGYSVRVDEGPYKELKRDQLYLKVGAKNRLQTSPALAVLLLEPI